MKLLAFANAQHELKEASVKSENVHLAMDKMIKFIQKKLDVKLLKVPGVEHFNNSSDHGYGVRYIFSGSTKCLRFNWASDGQAGKSNEIVSVDIFNGKTSHPNFNVHCKGISFVRALPVIIDIIGSPSLGKVTAFPVNPTEAISESFLIEVARDAFTAERALTDFLKRLGAGNALTRSDFIGSYHIVNVGIFDTIMRDFKDSFSISGKRVSIKVGSNLGDLKESILSKSGSVIVTAGGTDENYLKTPQEDELAEEEGSDHVPYSDALEHLEGLVTGTIKGAFNALFVAGKGGCFSGDTKINIVVNDLVHTVTFFEIEQRVKQSYGLASLLLNEFYKMDDVKVETPTGYLDVLSFVKKSGTKAVVTFQSGIVHECLSNHLYINTSGHAVAVYNLYPGSPIRMRDGTLDFIKSVALTDEPMLAFDLSVSGIDSIYVTTDGIQSHNTGKTTIVEKVLHSHGLTDGNGYYKNTGSASAIGIYQSLYKNRNSIILFDDCDGALSDTDARNLIKAATDTKKNRKIVWNKRTSGSYDPNDMNAALYAEDPDRFPTHFEFTGRVIFISNLPLSKLDPDGAIRTRAFVININPTDDEMYEHMEKILHNIRLEEGLSLSKDERENVFKVVKTSKRKGDVSIRKLVRALNLAATHAPGWEKLVDLYA